MRIVLAALIVAGVVGGPAYAQVSLDKNRNTNQPININSDTLEVQQDKQLAIFRGKVDAVQGDTRQIGRAHVCTPVTNAHLVCRLLLEQKKTNTKTNKYRTNHKNIT